MADHNPALLARFVSALHEATSISLARRDLEVAFATGGSRGRLDALLSMTLPMGEKVELAVDVLRAGYPRDVRLAVHQLHSYQAARRDSTLPLELCVLADYLSPGSRKELQQAGVNYFDGTGSLRFTHRTILVVVERETRTRTPRRAQKLFSGAREQVVHALLEHWRQTGGRTISQVCVGA